MKTNTFQTGNTTLQRCFFDPAYADYDYTATIGGYSNSVTSTNGYVISDPDGILGAHAESTYDFAAGKTGVLSIIHLGITEARGLYKEDGSYEDGYTSSNDLGRIYCNRIYNSTNLSETIWTGDTQYVDFTVTLTPTNVTLPAGARVVWEWEDPDDPSDFGMASNAAAHVDPNGSVGNDNTGTNDAGVVWEEIDSAYALSGTNETAISNGISKVRFNVTDDGGDNFIVTAKLKLDVGATPCDGDDTGVMTVWKLIQLENTKMPSGNNLPFSSLNDHFKEAFVQWDALSPRSVSDQDPIGTNEVSAYAATTNYVEAPPTGNFNHAGDGGWFFMASAGRYVPSAGLTSEKLIDFNTNGQSEVVAGYLGTGLVHIAGVIQVPQSIPTNKSVDFIEIYKADESNYVLFGAFVHPTLRDFIYAFAPNYQPEDDPNSDDYKYLPDHGFAVGSTNKVNVYSPGDLVTSGISPPITVGDDIFFQGRTVVFKFGGLGTMVHELTHGLGMAHVCGNKDHTGTKTCVMMYNHYWLQDASGDLVPWSAWNKDNDLCAPHILHIRKANLEDDASAKARKLGW